MERELKESISLKKLNGDVEYSSNIVDYWETKLSYLIWLADQAQKDGNFDLVAELDEEIQRIRRILDLLRRASYKTQSEHTLSR